jgi:hypothetical protein
MSETLAGWLALASGAVLIGYVVALMLVEGFIIR